MPAIGGKADMARGFPSHIPNLLDLASWLPGPNCCPSRLLFPQSFELLSRSDTRIKYRVPRIAASGIPLVHRTQIDTLVGEIVTTRVPQLVRMHAFEFSLPPRLSDKVIHCLTRHWLPAFGDE